MVESKLNEFLMNTEGKKPDQKNPPGENLLD